MSAPRLEPRDIPPTAVETAIGALSTWRRVPLASSVNERLAAFEALSTRLMERHDAAIPGAAFLAGFLRSTHMKELLRREIPQIEALERFVSVGAKSELRVVPIGAVSHWIAGNVPLLAVFSWALSAVFGNVNLIRVSSRTEDILSPIVSRVGELSAAGGEMAERTRVVAFERNDIASHEAMSRFADLRIAWGGEEAVTAVRALPKRWECDDLVFGPRRSYAVVDPVLADERMVNRLANDIVYFDQLACSSPQTVFVRGVHGSEEICRFVARLGMALDAGTRRFPRHALDWSETYLIELDRQRAVLEGGAVHRDKATQWTIAVLDAPVPRISCANRFVQVVPYAGIEDIAVAMPENVQTVVMLLPDEEAVSMSSRLAWHGVCRFPRPGMGNSFEIPWDGIAVAPRLAHWVTRVV